MFSPVTRRCLACVATVTVLALLTACERSSPPASGTAGPKKELRPADFQAQIAEFDRRIESKPNDIEAYVERGEARGRLSRYEPSDESWTLCRDAWDDFRKAHELAGGTWDFPDLLKSVRSSQTGAPRPVPRTTGLGSSKGGSVAALMKAYRLCGQFYQFDLMARLVQRAAQLDPNHPEVRMGIIMTQARMDGNWK